MPRPRRLVRNVTVVGCDNMRETIPSESRIFGFFTLDILSFVHVHRSRSKTHGSKCTPDVTSPRRASTQRLSEDQRQPTARCPSPVTT
jgi:hypothetical protein